jgi:hypothetical protein
VGSLMSPSLSVEASPSQMMAKLSNSQGTPEGYSGQGLRWMTSTKSVRAKSGTK